MGLLARAGSGLSGTPRPVVLLLAVTLLVSATPPSAAGTARVAAAGDIACDPGHPDFRRGQGSTTACRQKATSELLLGRNLDAVLLLGDVQYEDGARFKYDLSFGPSWGRLGELLEPAPGNHDYRTPGAAGYFDYFGTAAGRPGESWRSFDLGEWHLIALDSNCSAVGGCGPGSEQDRWLVADLAAHRDRCILAYWHHPPFSSGAHGGTPATRSFFERLYAAGADLVLTGHDHDYERFAPLDPAGRVVPRGVRSFVVGTGGHSLRGFRTVEPGSEVRHAGDFGALELTLRPGGYSWTFLTEEGEAIDTGAGLCHDTRVASTVLPLGDGRFTATVTFRTRSGEQRAGRVVDAATAADSGLFWFFSPDNWELLVKVLDGCALNDHHWVFVAATTDVEYHLTVTDTRTGAVATYDNPLGRAAPAVTDTRAFGTCP